MDHVPFSNTFTIRTREEDEDYFENNVPYGLFMRVEDEVLALRAYRFQTELEMAAIVASYEQMKRDFNDDMISMAKRVHLMAKHVPDDKKYLAKPMDQWTADNWEAYENGGDSKL
jgi:hypothetical protein